MTVEQSVVGRLKGFSAVSAIVAARVYQLKLPQSPTYPAVRVQLIDEPRDLHLRGGVNAIRSLVQVDAYANEFDSMNPDPYATSSILADAIDAALLGQVFTSADSPASVQVTSVMRTSRQPMYDPDELRVVRLMQEYVVWWKSLR